MRKKKMNKYFLVTSIYSGKGNVISENHIFRRNYKEAKDCYNYTIMQKMEGFELIGLYITEYIKNKQTTYDAFFKYEKDEDNGIKKTRSIDTSKTECGIRKIPR